MTKGPITSETITTADLSGAINPLQAHKRGSILRVWNRMKLWTHCKSTR